MPLTARGWMFELADGAGAPAGHERVVAPAGTDEAPASLCPPTVYLKSQWASVHVLAQVELCIIMLEYVWLAAVESRGAAADLVLAGMQAMAWG
jgi:hypothetical protein